MTGNSEQYHHQFECEPPRFDNDELVRRYQAGEFLYFTEKEDARRILAARAAADKLAHFRKLHDETMKMLEGSNA
jgi:hypothetical protein